MPKIFLLACILEFAAIANSQNMLIHQTGGGVVRVPLSDIQKLTFVMPTTGIQGDLPSALRHMRMVTANIFPNPFNPTTAIRYTVPQANQVNISVFDMSGKLVRVVEQGNKIAGEYSVGWNGKDDNGKQVSSGTYLTTITVGNKVLSKKAMFLK